MPLPSILTLICAALGLSVVRVAEVVVALAAMWGWACLENYMEKRDAESR